MKIDAGQITAIIQGLNFGLQAAKEITAILNAQGEITESELAQINKDGKFEDSEMAKRTQAHKEALGLE